MDYNTRAQRLVEIPLFEDEWEDTQKENKVWWEKKEADKIEMAIKKREQDISTRDRLLRMKDDRDDFVADLLTSLVCTSFSFCYPILMYTGIY